MKNNKTNSLIFYTIGDWGAYQQESLQIMKKISLQMSKLVHYKKPQFIMTLGDNFYDRGVRSMYDQLWYSCWKDIFINPHENMKDIKWHAILGNHDYFGGYDSVEAQIYRTNIDNNWFLPNENYYYRDERTNSYFIHIDTCKIYPELYAETSLMISKRQIMETLNYLEFVLERANRYGANWIFVFGHYHIFSNGYYKNYKIMEERLLPLLEKYNVDVYFCGHEHNYQVLKYNKLKLIINGAGSYCSDVTTYNYNKDVQTIFTSKSNGFTFHNLSKNNFTINFVNSDGKLEHKYELTK